MPYKICNDITYYDYRNRLKVTILHKRAKILKFNLAATWTETIAQCNITITWPKYKVKIKEHEPNLRR